MILSPPEIQKTHNLPIKRPKIEKYRKKLQYIWGLGVQYAPDGGQFLLCFQDNVRVMLYQGRKFGFIFLIYLKTVFLKVL